MKLGTFLILATTTAVLINAQNLAAGEPALLDRSEQTIPNQQIAYAAPPENSFLAMRALASRKIFRDDPNLYSATTPSGRIDDVLIESWRERVFTSLGTHLIPREPATGFPQEQDAEMRMVARIAMRETVKLTLERLPEIDRLVKALKLEISTDAIAGDAGLETAESPTIRTAAVLRPVQKERFFMKTGLRIPVESGKAGLVSETDAVYGSFSSFFRVDNRLDSALGLRYVLGQDVRLQAERQVAHASDDAGNRAILNMVQVVCAF